MNKFLKTFLITFIIFQVSFFLFIGLSIYHALATHFYPLLVIAIATIVAYTLVIKSIFGSLSMLKEILGLVKEEGEEKIEVPEI